LARARRGQRSLGGANSELLQNLNVTLTLDCNCLVGLAASIASAASAFHN